MAKVIATSKGYFGGIIREIGASFGIPDELWADKERRPKWVRLDPGSVFGGKGDHDGDGKVGGSKPAADPKPAGDAPAAIVVPADWQSMTAVHRKALAKSISGSNVPNVAEADRIILAFVDSNKPAPFGDAPAPETAKGNGIQEALGGVEPDWVAPNDQ